MIGLVDAQIRNREGGAVGSRRSLRRRQGVAALARRNDACR